MLYHVFTIFQRELLIREHASMLRFPYVGCLVWWEESAQILLFSRDYFVYLWHKTILDRMLLS
jgi:hypothetical protein